MTDPGVPQAARAWLQNIGKPQVQLATVTTSATHRHAYLFVVLGMLEHERFSCATLYAAAARVMWTCHGSLKVLSRRECWEACEPSPRPAIPTYSYVGLRALFLCKPTTNYHPDTCHGHPAGRRRRWSAHNPPQK